MRIVLLAALAAATLSLAQPQNGLGSPVVFVETEKGDFTFQTFPDDAPKTVAHVVELVKKGFYDGQRFHRVVPGFVVQWGDPRSRDLSLKDDWGRGPAAASGAPVGLAEITKKHPHVAGAVALAHPGDPALGDSQIYITLAPRPDLDGKYTVFGQVVAGLSVVERLQVGDVIERMTVRD